MDFLNWRNIVAVLLGAVVAGAIIGAYKVYENSKRNSIGEKLYKVELLLLQNKTAEAEKLADEIPPPSSAYAYLKLGDYFFSADKPQKALRYYTEAEKELRELDYPLYYFTVEKKAYLLYRMGLFKKSLGELEAIDETAPNFCSAQLLRGQDYIALGEKEKARRTLVKVVELCGADPEVVSTAKYLLATAFKEK